MSLSSILALVDRKGEAVIVREDGQAYIILPLDSYQDLETRVSASADSYVDGWLTGTDSQSQENIPLLTKEQLVDKINCDIALWKSWQQIPIFEKKEDFGIENEENKDDEEDEEDADADQVYLEPVM